MNAYYQVNLKDFIDELGEEDVKSILFSFSSPFNQDIETFLREKAIEFSRQRLAATYLVFTKFKDNLELVGYYTLSNKTIDIFKKNLSSKLRGRIKKFAEYNDALKKYTLSAILIAQLGKNYTNDFDKLITGDELLKMACDRVNEIQIMLSGKVVYLECENVPRLQKFYMENGFSYFGERGLDPDESSQFKTKSLIQMLKYL